MDGPGSVPAAGLFGSLQRVLGTLLEMAQSRLDLLTAELEREKLRIFDSLVRAAIALLLLALGLLLLAALLVMLAPQPLRLGVLALLALTSLAGGAWLLRQARHRLSTPAGALAATRDELARDRAALKPLL